jgi:hypothetical protein
MPVFFDDVETENLKLLKFEDYFYYGLMPYSEYQTKKITLLNTMIKPGKADELKDSPLYFLKKIKDSFPRPWRNKLDALKEVSEENSSLKDKEFEYQHFLELGILSIIINMLDTLFTYNCLHEKIVDEKINAILNYFNNYPFKTLNKNGDLIDNTFYPNFVTHFIEKTPSKYSKTDTYESINYRQQTKINFLFSFVLKLKTVKEHHFNGFVNMSNFCDNFDATVMVSLPWDINASLEIDDTERKLRTINYRADFEFKSGQNIEGIPIEEGFWIDLDTLISEKKTNKHPMSYFLGLLTPEKGDCAIGAESFMECLRIALGSNFDLFEVMDGAKQTLSRIRNKIIILNYLGKICYRREVFLT